jgi:hypothetical protein
MENKLVVFKGKEIKRTFYNNEWWFVIADVQFQVQMHGALETITGWDNTDKRRLHSSRGGPLWVPGTIMKVEEGKRRGKIDCDGFWSFIE